MKKLITNIKILSNLFFFFSTFSFIAMERCTIPTLAQLAARKIPQSSQLPKDLQHIIAREEFCEPDNKIVTTLARFTTVQKKALPLTNGHADHIRLAKISPDGNYFVTVPSTDTTIKIWDMQNGTCQDFQANNLVFAVDWVNTNDALVIAGNAPDIGLYEISAQALILCRKFSRHNRNILSVEINTDQTKLLSSSNDKTLKVWDFNTGELLKRFEYDKTLPKATWCGEKIVVATGDNRDVLVCDPDFGTVTRFREWFFIQGLRDYPWTIKMSHDGKAVLIGDFNGWMKKVDVATGKEIVKKFGKRILNVLPLKNGNAIIHCLDTKKMNRPVVMVDQQLKIVKEFPQAPNDYVEAIALSPDKNELLILTMLGFTRKRSMQVYAVHNRSIHGFLTKQASIEQLEFIKKVSEIIDQQKKVRVKEDSPAHTILITLPENVKMALAQAGLRIMYSSINS